MGAKLQSTWSGLGYRRACVPLGARPGRSHALPERAQSGKTAAPLRPGSSGVPRQQNWHWSRTLPGDTAKGARAPPLLAWQQAMSRKARQRPSTTTVPSSPVQSRHHSSVAAQQLAVVSIARTESACHQVSRPSALLPPLSFPVFPHFPRPQTSVRPVYSVLSVSHASRTHTQETRPGPQPQGFPN